jgi:hypothetical protein
MQKFLNEEATHLSKQFKKHPFIPVIIIITIIAGIVSLTLGMLCNTSFKCSDAEKDVALHIGVNLCIITAVAIIIPCILRYILNCIYYEKTVLPVTVMTPIRRKSSPL